MNALINYGYLGYLGESAPDNVASGANFLDRDSWSSASDQAEYMAKNKQWLALAESIWNMSYFEKGYDGSFDSVYSAIQSADPSDLTKIRGLFGSVEEALKNPIYAVNTASFLRALIRDYMWEDAQPAQPQPAQPAQPAQPTQPTQPAQPSSSDNNDELDITSKKGNIDWGTIGLYGLAIAVPVGILILKSKKII